MGFVVVDSTRRHFYPRDDDGGGGDDVQELEPALLTLSFYDVQRLFNWLLSASNSSDGAKHTRTTHQHTHTHTKLP